MRRLIFSLLDDDALNKSPLVAPLPPSASEVAEGASDDGWLLKGAHDFPRRREHSQRIQAALAGARRRSGGPALPSSRPLSRFFRRLRLSLKWRHRSRVNMKNEGRFFLDRTSSRAEVNRGD